MTQPQNTKNAVPSSQSPRLLVASRTALLMGITFGVMGVIGAFTVSAFGGWTAFTGPQESAAANLYLLIKAVSVPVCALWLILIVAGMRSSRSASLISPKLALLYLVLIILQPSRNLTDRILLPGTISVASRVMLAALLVGAVWSACLYLARFWSGVDWREDAEK